MADQSHTLRLGNGSTAGSFLEPKRELGEVVENGRAMRTQFARRAEAAVRVTDSRRAIAGGVLELRAAAMAVIARVDINSR